MFIDLAISQLLSRFILDNVKTMQNKLRGRPAMSTGNEDMQGTNRQRVHSANGNKMTDTKGQTINANCFRASQHKGNDMGHFQCKQNQFEGLRKVPLYKKVSCNCSIL